MITSDKLLIVLLIMVPTLAFGLTLACLEWIIFREIIFFYKKLCNGKVIFFFKIRKIKHVRRKLKKVGKPNSKICSVHCCLKINKVLLYKSICNFLPTVTFKEATPYVGIWWEWHACNDFLSFLDLSIFSQEVYYAMVMIMFWWNPIPGSHLPENFHAFVY